MATTNLEWDDIYALGIPEIDRQHKKLFEIVEKIFALKECHNVKEEIRTILYELNDYVKEHFQDEEKYMQKIGFPDLESHKEIHQEIINNVTNIAKNTHRLDAIQTKMRVVAKRILIDHILNEDMKIKVYQSSLHVNTTEQNPDTIISLD